MRELLVKNISVTLEDNQILSDVSLAVPRGKLVGLIGPNGAGKSILLKSILGLIEGATGEVILDDNELSSWSLKERAQKIAYAAQGAPVHWPLTVEHLVSLGRIPFLTPWQSTSEDDLSRIHGAMKKTDVAHLSHRITTTLSGGERARVMLARAIVSNTDFLLADEPIEALDPRHQIQIMKILKNLAEEGHGVLLVLHDLNFAQKYCDDLVLLDHGKVIASGTPDDVLTDDNLAKSYRVRAKRLSQNGETYIVPDALI